MGLATKIAELEEELQWVHDWLQEYFMEPGAVHEMAYDDRYSAAVAREKLLIKAIRKGGRRLHGARQDPSRRPKPFGAPAEGDIPF